MTTDPAEIIREALSLPVEARAALLDSLLESMDTEVDADAEEVWRAEIDHRIRQIDSGAVGLVPWEEAHRSLQARLNR